MKGGPLAKAFGAAIVGASPTKVESQSIFTRITGEVCEFDKKWHKYSSIEFKTRNRYSFLMKDLVPGTYTEGWTTWG